MGVFPWTGAHPIPWYSPEPRAVLRPDALVIRRSLRKVIRGGRFEVAVDTRFDALLQLCATQPRRGQSGTWITPNLARTWGALHRSGRAHSVEVYADGALAGGLYGMALGGAFFGESMVSLRRDASKVALAALCERLGAWGFHLIDCQAMTPHLASLGAVGLRRAVYLRALRSALAAPARWGGAGAVV